MLSVDCASLAALSSRLTLFRQRKDPGLRKAEGQRVGNGGNDVSSVEKSTAITIQPTHQDNCTGNSRPLSENQIETTRLQDSTQHGPDRSAARALNSDACRLGG